MGTLATINYQPQGGLLYPKRKRSTREGAYKQRSDEILRKSEREKRTVMTQARLLTYGTTAGWYSGTRTILRMGAVGSYVRVTGTTKRKQRESC
jgi:hypothetical protein